MGAAMSEYELSYLVRMGAGKHPQCHGWFTEPKLELVFGGAVQGVTATCALGAATLALMSITGLDYDEALSHVVDASWKVQTPKGEAQVPQWNDVDRLTRETIADHLDALPGGSPVVRV
jgi:hypothetical protein